MVYSFHSSICLDSVSSLTTNLHGQVSQDCVLDEANPEQKRFKKVESLSVMSVLRMYQRPGCP